MRYKKFLYILTVVIVVIVVFVSSFTVSALTTYNFVCSRPQINNNSCYFEIVTDADSVYVMYVSISLEGLGLDEHLDTERYSINFDTKFENGNLWVYPSDISSFSDLSEVVLEDYNIYGVIIRQDGSSWSSTLVLDNSINPDGEAVGIYVGANYRCIRAYNANFITDRGNDIVFAYGNEVNTNEKLDQIIAGIQGGNQDIINSQKENADKIIQNQEENQSEITNGWQQEESIDTSTTDDYADKDKELQGATEQGRSQTVSVFNNFGSLFQSDGHLYKGLMSVSAIFTEFFKIDWISSLINFSLALGVFAFVIGTGSAVFKSAHEKFNNKKSSSEERGYE